MATLLLLPIEPLRAGLDHPSRLFVNVGAVPLDVYHQQNTANTSGWFPNCSTSKTRRQCMQDALAAFYTDRVRGVRFSFSVYGGWDSTALDSSGNVRSTWRTRLQEFYDDVYDSGMRNVVVTPRLEPVTSSDGVVQVTELDSCTGTNKTYWYGKISPVPYQDFGWPVNSGGNNTYNCAPQNTTNFIGWTKVYALVDAVLEEADAAGLTVYELDLYNESNLQDFTVLGRLIHDTSGRTGRSVAEDPTKPGVSAA